MPARRYRIFHDDRGLPKGEFPLSRELINHHISYLPSELSRYFDNNVNVIAEVIGNEVRVSLESSRDADHLDNLFVQCIREINKRTSGLSFLIERIE